MTLDGHTISAFKTDKVRALLAYLAVEHGQVHRRDGLATLLWPQGSDELARTNLRQSLCRLRDALAESRPADPLILATPEAVQLDPTADLWVDVSEFDRLVAACAAHRHRSLVGCSSCASRLAQAVELYAGEFLAGLCVRDCPAYTEWCVVRQEALHRRAMEALQILATHYQQAGNATAAEIYLHRQLALEPWCEAAHRQLMVLFATSGRRDLAAAQYARCSDTLREQLGLAPEGETSALFESIRGGKFRDSTPPGRLLNWPPQPVRLTGRAQELAAIRETLENPDCRLLTLVGIGGSGKTSLALHTAALAAGAFRDGACFCSLDSPSAAESPVLALAEALGLDYTGPDDAQAQVRHLLRDKEMLLVLDHAEQSSVADWIARILHAAPRTVILATAQHALSIHGEWRIEVPGLPYPSKGSAIDCTEAMTYSAVWFFVQRAAQVRPGFGITVENVHLIARICRQVEGLPLALELAASWLGILTCAEIAEAIEANLDFLATAWRDVPVRQRSMRAAFDYSWGLLSLEEQDAFACLSVFDGEFSHAAARAVVGTPCAAYCRHAGGGEKTVPGADCLFRGFVYKALLHESAPGRFRQHSLLRQYAESKLAGRQALADAARGRFVDYFAGLVRRAEAARDEFQAETWRNRLLLERHNIETALTLALQSHPQAVPALLAAVQRRCMNV